MVVNPVVCIEVEATIREVGFCSCLRGMHLAERLRLQLIGPERQCSHDMEFRGSYESYVYQKENNQYYYECNLNVGAKIALSPPSTGWQARPRRVRRP